MPYCNLSTDQRTVPWSSTKVIKNSDAAIKFDEKVDKKVTFWRSTPCLGITGSVLLIIFKSLISLCFITCLIRISLNLKNDQKNRPHDPKNRPHDPYTTDIKNVKVNRQRETHVDSHIYNLSGQRLSKHLKGINIVNGKKVVMK